MNLKGTNAIVTGGSRGIGPYIARALAREGINIALAARDAERLEAVRNEVESLGVKALNIPTDVNLADDRRNLIEQARSRSPTLSSAPPSTTLRRSSSPRSAAGRLLPQPPSLRSLVRS